MLPTSRLQVSAALVLLCFGSTACLAPKHVRSLGSAVAIRGKDVSQAALDVYADLAKQRDIDKSQQDFIKIVTHPSPASARVDTNPRPFTKQLAPRIQAYSALLRAFSTFQSLTDKSKGDQVSAAGTALAGSFNALKGVPDLPSPVTAAIAGIGKLIVDAQQSKSILKYNLALAELTKTYLQLWDEDMPIWQQYVTEIYKEYADGFSSLTPEQIDAGRLPATPDQPFMQPIRIGLYKVNERNRAVEKRDILLDKLNRVHQAFVQLDSAQTELAKAKPSLQDAFASLDSLQGILGK